MGLMSGLATLKKDLGRRYWDFYSKEVFLSSCPMHASVLDVGCGNDSPEVFKRLRPDFHYVGIDVAEYNQSADPRVYANQYILASPEKFNDEIEALPVRFDAVVSAHNIEHCEDPKRTLSAMLRCLKPGGRIFMSFPCEASAGFPSRGGTLNFFDDPTHKILPSFLDICSDIRSAGFVINVAKPRYRPLVRVFEGLRNEISSWRTNRVLGGTWALYGFETIIWATRPSRDPEGGSSQDELFQSRKTHANPDP